MIYLKYKNALAVRDTRHFPDPPIFFACKSFFSIYHYNDFSPTLPHSIYLKITRRSISTDALKKTGAKRGRGGENPSIAIS